MTWLVIIAGVILETGALWWALRYLGPQPDADVCSGWWAEARLRGCRHDLSVPVEPVNTYTNLAYLAAGLTLVGWRPSWPAAVMAAALAILCVGSSLYHGLKTHWAERLDVAGMYCVFGAMAIYALAPDHPWIGPVMLGGMTVGALTLNRPGDLNERMGILLTLISLRGFLLGHAWLALASLTIFAVAYLAWNLDHRDPPPTGRYGHAIWHVCTAAAIALMFVAIT